MIPRLQLLELHEQPWCPAAVRAGAMDCLRLIATVGNQYQHVLPRLQAALTATGCTEILDLCSGSGGPWPVLVAQLQRETESLAVTLTDRYPPPLARTHGSIHYHPTPVDATAVPATLTGFRTLFTAFHHFEPERARAILQDAVIQRRGIAIFEQTRRHPLACLLMLLLAPLACLLVPFIRPWRLDRFFWTYLIPAIPLVLGIDGVVSCLRTYTQEEMATLVATLDGVDGAPYDWEIGHAKAPLSPLGISYAIGYPASASVTANEQHHISHSASP